MYAVIEYLHFAGMLHILQWPTLEKKGTISHAIVMFEIINGIIDIPVEPTIFTSNNQPTGGHQQKFIRLPTRTDAYLNSFFPIQSESGTHCLLY